MSDRAMPEHLRRPRDPRSARRASAICWRALPRAGRAREDERARLRAHPRRTSIPREVDLARRARRGCRSRASPTSKALQAEIRPLGGLNATPVEKLAKIFVSPGPIYEPEGYGQRLVAHRPRRCTPPASAPGDLVANTFSYHFTPAGSMLETGALACGCTVVPTGIGQTEMQVADDRRPAASAATSARRRSSS